jgi:hypothetical protein
MYLNDCVGDRVAVRQIDNFHASTPENSFVYILRQSAACCFFLCKCQSLLLLVYVFHLLYFVNLCVGFITNQENIEHSDWLSPHMMRREKNFISISHDELFIVQYWTTSTFFHSFIIKQLADFSSFELKCADGKQGTYLVI